MMNPAIFAAGFIFNDNESIYNRLYVMSVLSVKYQFITC